MTYLQFHLVFIVPPILGLLYLQYRQGGAPAGRFDPGGARTLPALGVILALALAYTTPWDNHLVARGVWGYPPERVLATIGYVPVEEYAFFLLQPILTGLFLFALGRRTAEPEPTAQGVRRMGGTIGTAFFVLLTALGFLLTGDDSTYYLGLILAWASPIAALQWAVGGGALVTHWRDVMAAVAIPTVYLWLADRIAIGLGIWYISPRYTTGVHLFGLPVEEALFFAYTNVIVVQGLLLFLVLLRGARFARVRGWTR